MDRKPGEAGQWSSHIRGRNREPYGVPELCIEADGALGRGTVIYLNGEFL